jgi:hypothetical protein
MKRITSLSMVSLLLLQNIQAQIRIKQRGEGEHRVSLTFTPQQYLNSINIRGEGQPQVIHTKNTFGYKLGLDYQRTTRYGLIFGSGISYGSQRNIIDIVYSSDMSWFDPYADHPEQLVGQQEAKLNYAFTSKYAALQLKAGYSFKLPANWDKGWRVETTLGVTSRLYLNDPDVNNPEQDPSWTWWRMMYEKGGQSYLSTFATEYGSFSDKGVSILATAEAYIGISKAVNLGWLRNFSLGIEVSKSFFHRGGSAYFDNYVKDFYGKQVAHNVYESKNLSLGIKMSVGLWPNIKNRR